MGGVLDRPDSGTVRPWLTTWLLLASALFQGIYYVGLTRSYRSSDFTVVYPLARALPVLLLAVVDLMRDRMPTLQPGRSAQATEHSQVTRGKVNPTSIDVKSAPTPDWRPPVESGQALSARSGLRCASPRPQVAARLCSSMPLFSAPIR